MTLAAPDVSIVMPARNVAPWIRDALESILAEDAVGIEVIVVDDGSVDGTQDIVRSIADSDARVRLVRGLGSGGAQARNFGVSLATGRYIAFSDADDLVARNAYSRLFAAAEAAEAEVVVGDFVKFSSSRLWYPTEKWDAFANNAVELDLDRHPSAIRHRACWNRLFLRTFWDREALYFPSVRRSNDIVPMTKALLRARRVSMISDVVYLYRERPGAGSMTAAAGEAQSVDSYFRQEAECAVLVAGHGSHSVTREYTTLVLAADGFVHLARVLRGSEGAEVDVQPIASHLQRILRHLDPGAADEVHPQRQWLFALAAQNEWAAARQLLALVEQRVEPSWGLTELLSWIARSGSFVTPRAMAWMLSRFAIPQMTQLQAEEAARLAPAVLPLSTVLRELESGGIELGKTPLQRRVASAITSGSLPVLQAEMGRPTLRVRARSANLSDDGVLDVHFRLPIAAKEAQVVARDAAGDEFKLATLDPSHDVHALTLNLRSATLGVGAWDLSVQVTDDLGDWRLPLVLTGSTSSTSRFSRWVLVPRRRRPKDQVLLMRDHLLVRARRKAKRTLGARPVKDGVSKTPAR